MSDFKAQSGPPQSEIDAILDNAYTSATSDGRLGGDTEYARKAFIISRKAALSRLIEAEVQRKLEKLKDQRVTYPIHGGSDSFIATKYVEAVPLRIIEAELEAGSGEADHE